LNRSGQLSDHPLFIAVTGNAGGTKRNPAMQLGLKGRSALVTGASKGIGRAIALQLAQEGVDVAITARSEKQLESVRSEIAARAPVTVRVVPPDLSIGRSAEVLAAECANVDILVNNAGAIPRGRIDEIDEQRWRTAWDLKVFGYINMTRAFYALMKQRRSGVIINILGNGGERVDAGYVCGSAGNAALMAFTRAIGGASHKDGVRGVGINPRPAATQPLPGRDGAPGRIDAEGSEGPFRVSRAMAGADEAISIRARRDVGGDRRHDRVARVRPVRLHDGHDHHHRRRHGQRGLAHLTSCD